MLTQLTQVTPVHLVSPLWISWFNSTFIYFSRPFDTSMWKYGPMKQFVPADVTCRSEQQIRMKTIRMTSPRSWWRCSSIPLAWKQQQQQPEDVSRFFNLLVDLKENRGSLETCGWSIDSSPDVPMRRRRQIKGGAKHSAVCWLVNTEWTRHVAAGNCELVNCKVHSICTANYVYCEL